MPEAGWEGGGRGRVPRPPGPRPGRPRLAGVAEPVGGRERVCKRRLIEGQKTGIFTQPEGMALVYKRNREKALNVRAVLRRAPFFGRNVMDLCRLGNK